MDYLLQQADENQQKLNKLRPLTGNKLKNVKGYYRVSLTYTSNAIEGNTLTESETKVILEEGLTVGGHPLREVYEVIGHASAYDFMWEMAKADTLNENDIKKLHELFYIQINDSLAGKYRGEDVVITGSKHPVAAWKDILAEMGGIAAWMKNERSQYHPIVFAAELHRRFIYIHPFIDGNGRIARLLLNLALLQKGYEIVTIPPICRSYYVHALEVGHGNPKVFHDFIIDREVEAQKNMMRLFHIPIKSEPGSER